MTTTSHDQHTRITDEYLDMRARLEGASGELKSLQEKRSTTLQASRDAGQRWRQIFKDAGGATSKEVRSLQKKEHTLAAEVEQLDDLISRRRRLATVQRIPQLCCGAARSAARFFDMASPR